MIDRVGAKKKDDRAQQRTSDVQKICDLLTIDFCSLVQLVGESSQARDDGVVTQPRPDRRKRRRADQTLSSGNRRMLNRARRAVGDAAVGIKISRRNTE